MQWRCVRGEDKGKKIEPGQADGRVDGPSKVVQYAAGYV